MRSAKQTVVNLALGAMAAALVSGGAASAQSILKVCKVAGAGVAVGTDFTFLVDGDAVAVKAGPPAADQATPGGWCRVVGRPREGSEVEIREDVPWGHTITDIDVQTAGRIVGTPNLGTGVVRVQTGPGVTEVTFVNERRTGYLEICKTGEVEGNFQFAVDGLGREITVPAGACSPAIEVPAGQHVVREIGTSATRMSGCATFPLDRLRQCRPERASVTIDVAAGDIASQTIVFVENARAEAAGRRRMKRRSAEMEKSMSAGWLAAPRPALSAANPNTLKAGAATQVICKAITSGPRPLTTCKATVSASEGVEAGLGGFVRFRNHEKNVALIPLINGNSATLAMSSTLSTKIVADYIGLDLALASAASQNASAGSGAGSTVDRRYRPGEPAPNDNLAERLNAESLQSLTAQEQQ